MQHIKTLVHWIASGFVTLPSGNELSFKRARTVPSTELDALESRRGRKLPAFYRTLLEEVGPSELFCAAEGEIEIYDPATLKEHFADYFEDADAALRRVLPVACDTRLQQLVVCFLDRKDGANVLIVAHDAPPDDWEGQADAEGLWITLEAWLAEAVATEGCMQAH